MKTVIRSALLSAVIAMSAFSAAQAQQPSKLTETAIRSFYSELASVFKRPYADFVRVYDERIHPDLELTTQSTVIVEGQAPMESEAVTVTKYDLITNATRTYQAARDATLSNQISGILIGEDGTAATVRSVSTVKGMDFPTAEGQSVKADSIETCDDTVILSGEGKIQIYKSSCKSEITIPR